MPFRSSAESGARGLKRAAPDMASAVAEKLVGTDESEPLVVSTAFGTVSEYFFLTMRAMHVGYLSSCSALQQLLCDPTAA